jgi:hypothetical protein
VPAIDDVGGVQCVIDLQALVDKESAWTLNAASTSKLNDLLVLHLRNGRDYFVTAAADYVPSCYGQSIERLMQSQTPIQHVQLIDLVLSFCPFVAAHSLFCFCIGRTFNDS